MFHFKLEWQQRLADFIPERTEDQPSHLQREESLEDRGKAERLDRLMVRFTRTWPRPHFLCIPTGSTLQRIEIGAGQLLHFAEVAGVKTKSRTKHLFFQSK
jgi:hypothetical protein